MADQDPKASGRQLKMLLGERADLTPEMMEELTQILALESLVEEKSRVQEQTSLLFDLSISEDKMSILLKFFPNELTDVVPDINDIMDVVMRSSFRCTIDTDLIDSAIQRYPLLHAVEMVIGSGQPVVDGCDGRLEFHVQDPNQLAIDSDTMEKVDYRRHHDIIDVKKDQELVTIHEPTEAIMGTNVFGELISARFGKPVTMTTGKNTYFVKETQTIYASIEGCLIRKGDQLLVDELLVIHGDLDMKTGSIETKSRVLVHGNVCEGFEIISDDDIVVEGNVEASSLTSRKGKIVIQGGYFGKGRSSLRAEKSIFCRFAQQGMLSCRGPIEIEDSLMHCTISCGESLVVTSGRHGVIVGGNIRIHSKIEAKVVGSLNGVRTDFIMGFDFDYEKVLREHDLKIMTLIAEIEEIKSQIDLVQRSNKIFPKDSRKYEENQLFELELRKHLLLMRLEYEDLAKLIKSLENKAFIKEQSQFIVLDEIFSNVYLHMLRKHHKFEGIHKGIKVLLDNVNETIQIEEMSV